ncbi:MAG: hypothetical protein O2779_03640 [Nanoarchaeota archaeon]|nr:hypothetical protein [Nanoarchaeota archaeon]
MSKSPKYFQHAVGYLREMYRGIKDRKGDPPSLLMDLNSSFQRREE